MKINTLSRLSIGSHTPFGVRASHPMPILLGIILITEILYNI